MIVMQRYEMLCCRETWTHQINDMCIFKRHEVLIDPHHLEKTALFKVQDSRGFPFVKRALGLNVPGVDEFVSD